MQYLNFTSNHPLKHKRGVVRTLLHRAEAIVRDPLELVEEKTHIKQALLWNGYPAWLLEGADTPPPAQTAEEEVEVNSLDPAPAQFRPNDPACRDHCS